jgi:tRNA threonylcarbamoyladenosine biosynthesis protein TsaE
MEYFVSGSDIETRSIAADLVSRVGSGDVVLLRGDLGSGKSVFASGIISSLGIDGPFPSPTFVIMHRYDLPVPSVRGIRRVYHIDAYRIDDPEELRKIGFEEWISDPEGLVIIEWPERVGTLVPGYGIDILMEWASDSDRRITVRSFSRSDSEPE